MAGPTKESFAVTVPGNGSDSGCGTLTRDQLNSKAAQFARTLKLLGLRPGDAIAVLMGNRIEVPVVLLGARWAGVDALPLSTHVPANRLAQLTETLRPKLLVASDDCISLANQLAGLINPGIVRMLATGDSSSHQDWMSFETIDAQPAHALTEQLNGRWLLTSGGSTGLQKIVEPQIAADGGSSLLASLVAVPAAAKVFGFNEQHVILVTGPLYHTMGSSIMAGALDAGAQLVIMRQEGRWSAQDFMDFIGTYGVTHTIMVPTMMSRVNTLLAAEPSSYDISTLQVVGHGAAPCPVSVKMTFMRHFPGIVYEVYGGTEGFVVTVASPKDWEAHPGTVGRPLCPVVIRDAEGQEVPDNTPGIIWGVVPQGTKPMSYMGRLAETAECIATRNGVTEGTLWDIGYMEDGLLFISGRKKDMIIVGGENTYPIEIEDVLHRHPRVVDVAVVGVPHDVLGEVPVAAIEVIDDGDHDTLVTELHALCREAGLSNHATPRKVVVVLQLPRTATGKMLKAEVLQLVLAAS